MSARRESRRLSPREIELRDGAVSARNRNAAPEPAPEPAPVPASAPVPESTSLAPVFTEPKASRRAKDNSATGGKEPDTWHLVSKVQIDLTDRRAALEKIRPRGPRAQVDAVRGVVVDLIMAVEHTSVRTDRQLMSAGIAFALFCRGSSPDGEFFPERDLTELKLYDFLTHELGERAQSTRATYASSIRRLAGDRTFRATNPRNYAQAPYTRDRARELWNAAFAYDDWTAVEMRTLLALTLGAGCLSEELLVLRASQIDRTPRRVVVTVARNHFVREVPVYGEYGRWLVERAKTLEADDLMFRPAYNDRRNAVSNLVKSTQSRTDAFIGFRAAKARHHWVAQHLQVGVAFNALSAAAGLTKNSNLFADLLPYLPNLQPIDIHRAFDRAYLTLQDKS